MNIHLPSTTALGTVARLLFPVRVDVPHGQRDQAGKDKQADFRVSHLPGALRLRFGLVSLCLSMYKPTIKMTAARTKRLASLTVISGSSWRNLSQPVGPK